jgi:hypothetical protein
MKGTELIPRFGADASPDQATRRLVWLAMATLPARQTAMVRVPPLGIGRRLDKGKCDSVAKCELMKGGQRRNFPICAFVQPLGNTPRPAMRVKQDPRAIWAVIEI